MTTLDPIRNRRSVRSYTSQEVSEEAVREILEAARLAPSGSNQQPWAFIVVRSDEMRARVSEACHNQQWMNQAPVHIVCVADPVSRDEGLRGSRVDEESPDEPVKTTIRCTVIAIEHLVLQAEAMGLSTCWIAWFTQDDIRPVLDIPEDRYVVAVITVGYSDDRPAARPRKPLEEIVRYESWS